jgi:hypothetical protein
MEVRTIAEAHRAAGGGLYLLTLTIPHDQGDRLEPLYHAVVDTYRYVRSGTRWYTIKERIAYLGEIRTLEATVGANGWHPHLHALIFTSRPLNAAELADLHAYFSNRWASRIELCGYRTPSAEHGVTIVESYRDDYLAKMGLADELVKGGSKDAHGGSRTPLQVLADFADTGESSDRDLWREWNLAMHGARHLTWSRGLRQRYRQGPEVSDEAIVAGDTDETEVRVAVIPLPTWQTLWRGDAAVTYQLLEAAETGGTVGVEQLIDGHVRGSLPLARLATPWAS